MFNKILVANRGEIAMRIIRSAKKLGVRTVAVFSDADIHAPHVKFADEAIHLGPSPAIESYLKIDKIIKSAKRTGAEAIHPGYGFLSENPDFAASCEKAGLCFIGPPEKVIRQMGSKHVAKALMVKNGVSVIPGFIGDISDNELAHEAEKIGFPLLIKASGGGGGRGMRLVHKEKQFPKALHSARREAKSTFGDETVFLEKYIPRPRHIEVQIFGDTHGNLIHLFDRDCSVQRRYQKLIEEAPASRLTAAERDHIHQTSLNAGKAIGYIGAGTVEFVVDENNNAYFIEMNTRLQVEHPVTEMITGRDLVALQLQVANGEELPPQIEISTTGHAFEMRLCAEDPTRDFAPSTGKISQLALPEHSYRVDHALTDDLDISPYYDSMLAKLIVHAEDRASALQHAIHALELTEIAGITTNQNLLKRILTHSDFVTERISTDFIDDHETELFAASPAKKSAIIVAALFIYEKRLIHSRVKNGPSSPWLIHNSFRLNLPNREEISIGIGDQVQVINVEHQKEGYVIGLDETDYQCFVDFLDGHEIDVRIDSARINARVVSTDARIDVFLANQQYVFTRQILHELGAAQFSTENGLAAPMPGLVINIFVETGQNVTVGTPLMTIEAMKIEHTITAPYDGTVAELPFKQGDKIPAEGVQLAIIKPS